MRRLLVLVVVAFALAIGGALADSGPSDSVGRAETPSAETARLSLEQESTGAQLQQPAAAPAAVARSTTRPSAAPATAVPATPLPPTAVPATAKPPSTEAAPASLPSFDSAMTSLLAQGYPGGSLAVVRDGRLVYTRGYGTAKPGVAATPLTRYRQASISKAVTATLLAKLVADRTVSLDLRAFQSLGVAPTDPRAGAITVRMLRDHTSGFATDYFLQSREAASFYAVPSPPDVDTMVRWTARHPLASEPGSTYRYNNTNYAILTRVIERATGRTWIDLLSAMAKPVGIGSWRIGPSLSRPADEATYYEAEAWRYLPSVYDSVPGTVEAPYGSYSAESLGGAVALVSTVIDMARYGQAVASGTLLTPEADPIPTKPGSSYTYIYNGSMPGQYTFVMRIWDGAHLTVIAGALNHRDAGAIDRTINQRILDAYRATTAWPAVDLFASY